MTGALNRKQASSQEARKHISTSATGSTGPAPTTLYHENIINVQ